MIALSQCLLRPMEWTDLPQVLVWRNAGKVREASLNNEIISNENHLKWFKKQGQDPAVRLFIFEYGQVPIGVLNFSQIDFFHKTAFWGFYRGTTMTTIRGLGLAMGWFGLNYIFDKILIEHIYADSLRANEISLSFHAKLGFVEECQKGFQIIRNGHSEDVARLSLSAAKWNQIKLELKGCLFA